MSQSFFARRSFLILMIVAFLCPFISMGSRRALRTNRNDVTDWLPQDFPETAVHSWFQKHFPFEQFVLASWEGCTLDDDRLGLLARKLVPPEGAERPDGKPQYFKSVMTGRSLVDDLMDQYGLSQEAALKRLEGSLIGPDLNQTCLIVTLSKEAEGKALRPMLEEMRELARQCRIEPAKAVPPEGLVARLGQQISRSAKELIFGRDPPGPGIRLGGPPVDNVAIDIEGEYTLYRLAGLSSLVGLTISWLCFRSIRLTMLIFSTAVLSTGIGIAIVFFSGGTYDAILLSMPSLVYVLAISGSIHIVNYYHDAIRENGLDGAPERALKLGWKPCAVAAVTTAVGLGSLYASHVIPIAKFGVYSAAGVLATLPMLFLFLPACLQFWPSRDYAAKFGGKGETVESETRSMRAWQGIGRFVIRRNGLVGIGCMVVMLVAAVPILTIWFPAGGLPRIKTTVKLMKLFSADAEIRHHYAWLEDQIGPLVPMEVIVRFDNRKCELSTVQRMRLVKRVERVVESLADVGGALSAATFAPRIPKKSQWLEDSVLNKRIERSRGEFHDYLTIDRDIAVVDGAVADGDSTGDSKWPINRFLDSEQLIERLEAAQVFTLADVEQYGNLSRIDGIDAETAVAILDAIEQWRSDHRDPTLDELAAVEGSKITPELVEKLKARKLNTLLAIEQYGHKKKSVAENLSSIDPAATVAAAVDRWRVSNGEELWRVSARVEALGDLDYGLFVDDLKMKVEPLLAAYREGLFEDMEGVGHVKGVDATYTGLVPLVYKTQHELMRGLFKSLALAFVLIAAVMIVVLKSPTAGLLSMVPNLFPVVVIFGAMGWMGILIDIGTMMTASVALGVAVDDTIHYLTWYRRGLDAGHDRKGAAMMAYRRCATAMTQTTLIGGLGLAVFAFSTFTPTQRFGMLMLTLLFTALFGDLIFLPAVLTGPIGRFFRGSGKSSGDKPPAQSPEQLPTESADPDSDVPQSTASANPSDEEFIRIPLAANDSGQSRPPDTSRRSTRAS
ncbi:MAG: MMPL family transporter [Thermoguttaceae bacterium]